MIVFLLFLSFVYAVEPNYLDDHQLRQRVCEAILDKNASDQIIPSGRDAHSIPELKAALEHVTQIALNLGFNLPPHQLNFASSEQISELASVGGYAAPHEIEGKKILDGRKTLAGVLEFVTPGCPTCRGFYRDNTKVSHNISVMMHVLGHNLVAGTSMYQAVRGGDAVVASLKLSHLMSELYDKYDPEFVKYYYQLLLSMAHMQDLAMGSYQSPESFKNIKDPDPKKGIRKPTSPTPSAIQYYVGNMPKDFPPWVHQMADLIEQIRRSDGFMMHTKILNEGVATFSQFLIARHSKYITSNDIVDLANLIQNVAIPDLKNPYWVGLNGCWNMWTQFILKPELKEFTPFERDRKFVTQVLMPMIEQSDNTKFIRQAFDRNWIARNKLVLKRKAEIDDVPVGNTEYKEKKIILSNFNNHERILKFIARQIAYRPLQVPRIHLYDEQHLGGTEVLYKHEVFEDIPLARITAAQTLFVFAKLWKKQVSLDTIGSSAWGVPPPKHFATFFGPPPPPAEISTFPIRITVDPAGNAIVTDPVSGKMYEDLTKLSKAAIDYYREDLDSSLNDDLLKIFEARNKDAVAAIVSSVVEPATSTISHSPTAAAAMVELAKSLEVRIPRAIRRALEKGQGIRTTAKGVALRVLPIIPEFSLDLSARQQKIKDLPPAPVDDDYDKNGPIDQDDGVELGTGTHIPGDLVDDKKSGKKGKSSQEKSEDEAEKSDDESAEKDADEVKESEEKPDKFDGAGKDPSEVEIPLEEWGKLLHQELELPNLRPIGDKSFIMDDSRAGSVQREGDPMVMDRTAEEAFMWGLARDKMEPNSSPPQNRIGEIRRIMKLGFKTMPMEEYFIRSREIIPHPEMSAVVVFVLDLTGSMKGLPQQRVKQLIYQIVSFIRAKYKDVDVRFVGFDDNAYEYFEPKIWDTFLGGGNTDSKGYIKAGEILADQKYQNSNKFVYGAGDSGSFDTAATINAMNSLSEIVQHMGYVEWSSGTWGTGEFSQAIRDLSNQISWFDFTQLNPDEGSIFQAMKDLYGKNKKR